MVEKKIKGAKIHILTDTQGFLIKSVCHKANIHDRTGAEQVLSNLKTNYPSIKAIFADGGYQGLSDFISKETDNDVKVIITKSLTPLKIGSKDFLQYDFLDDKPCFDKPVKMNNNDGSFPIVQWRWIVERTLSWLSRNRRLSKIYERLTSSVETYCNIAMSYLMVKRIRNTRKKKKDTKLAPSY
jgi:putative transposase